MQAFSDSVGEFSRYILTRAGTRQESITSFKAGVRREGFDGNATTEAFFATATPKFSTH